MINRRDLLKSKPTIISPSTIVLSIDGDIFKSFAFNKIKGRDIVVKNQENEVILELTGNISFQNPINIPRNWSGVKTVTITAERLSEISFAYSSAINSVQTMNLNQDMDLNSLFYNCSFLTTVDGINLNSKITRLQNMFYNCINLTQVTPFTLSKNTNLNNCFTHCSSLVNLPNLNYEDCIDLSFSFYYCSSLTSILYILNKPLKTKTLDFSFMGCSNLIGSVSYLNAPYCESAEYIFSGTGITSISNFTLPLVTSCSFREMVYLQSASSLQLTNLNYATNLFSDCINLNTVDYLFFKPSGLVNTVSMFKNCQSLTSTVNLDLSKVVNSSEMYYNCNNISSAYSFNLASVVNTSSMFSGCSKITSLTFNYSNIINLNTNYNNMFTGCTLLEVIPDLNYNNIYTGSGLFSHCTALPVTFSITLNNAIDLSACFLGCSNLNSVIINANNCKNFNFVFRDCINLVTPEIHTNITGASFNSSFMSCQNLSVLPVMQYKGSDFSQAFLGTGLTNLSNVTIELFNRIDSLEEPSLNYMFAECNDLLFIVNFTIDAKGRDLTIFSIFTNCIALTTFNGFTVINTAETNLHNINYYCTSLVNVSNFNLNNITSAIGLFSYTAVTDISFLNLDIVNLNNISDLFSYSKISTLSNFTTKALNINNMFKGCSYLTTINNLTLPTVTNAEGVFMDCVNLTNSGNLTFQNATTLSNFFNGCSSLAIVGNLIIPNVTSLYSCFNNNNSLVSIGSISCPNIVNMSFLFNYCFSLLNIPTITGTPSSIVGIFNFSGIQNYNNNIDLTNCTDFSSMFYGCNNLLTINNIHNNQAYVSAYNMINNCSSLVSVTNVDGYNFNSIQSPPLFNNCNSITTLNYINYRAGFIVPPLITNPLDLETIINSAGIPDYSYYNIINVGATRKATISSTVINNAIIKGWNII